MYKGYMDTWQEILIFTVKRDIIQILKENSAVHCPLVILKVLPRIIFCMHSNILYVFQHFHRLLGQKYIFNNLA